MRFWLAAFVVLFAAVELFEWIAQLGSWQPTGIWLVLGGMGLAALSNTAHWKQATDTNPLAESPEDKDKAAITESDSAVVARAGEPSQSMPSIAEPSAQDSISFKVRPLKR